MSERVDGGYLAVPEQGNGRGVLLLHAWWGLTPFFEQLAERFAGEGFTVFVPDLYGDGRTAATIEEAERFLPTLNEEQVYGRIIKGAALLRKHPSVTSESLGAVGFSMGSAYALVLDDRIGATVTFYGTNAAEAIRGDSPLQGHFAENDPYEPSEQIEQVQQVLKEQGRDVTFYSYPDSGHWFFEDNRPEYNAAAAELAWQRTVAFLKAHLT